MKPISPFMHNVLDYASVILFIAAPKVLGFGTVPAILTYVFAGIFLILTIFTASPLGIIKVIPFRTHGRIELVIAPVLLALPWLFGFSHMAAARNFYIVFAIVPLIVYSLTDFDAARQRYSSA